MIMCQVRIQSGVINKGKDGIPKRLRGNGYRLVQERKLQKTVAGLLSPCLLLKLSGFLTIKHSPARAGLRRLFRFGFESSPLSSNMRNQCGAD